MIGCVESNNMQTKNNDNKESAMKQKHTIRYVARKQDEMIDKIILEFYRF